MIKFLIAVVVVMIGIQFVPIKKTNPVTDKHFALVPPQNVAPILKKACYDCHSNETKWPWYSSYAPVSWSVIDHVEDGRKAMNFSSFKKMEQSLQTHRLRRAAQTITNARMPLKSYLEYHEEAVLTKDEQAILIEWFKNTLVEVNTRSVSYQCSNDVKIKVDITGNSANVIMENRPDTYVEYYVTPVGIKYTGGDVMFMIKGAYDAYFSIDDVVYQNCKVVE